MKWRPEIYFIENSTRESTWEHCRTTKSIRKIFFFLKFRTDIIEENVEKIFGFLRINSIHGSYINVHLYITHRHAIHN